MRSKHLSSSKLEFSTLGGKIVQNEKFSLISQNNHLSLKLNTTVQNKSRIYSVSKIEPRKHKNRNFMQNSLIMVTSKNTLLNRSSFDKSKTIIGFIVLHQV